MGDAQWKATEVPKANTPVKALRLILDNETFLGYDSYYGDLRSAMLNQAAKVAAEHEPREGALEALLQAAIAWRHGKPNSYALNEALRKAVDAYKSASAEKKV